MSKLVRIEMNMSEIVSVMMGILNKIYTCRISREVQANGLAFYCVLGGYVYHEATISGLYRDLDVLRAQEPNLNIFSTIYSENNKITIKVLVSLISETAS